MSIASATSKSGPYAGNGVTTVFAVAFACFAAADLSVVRTDAAGTDTTLTLATDYSVSLNADQTNSPGGTVTMVVAPPTGSQLTVLRNVAATQGTQLPNQGGWYPQVVEKALDKLTMLVQQLAEKVSRSVQIGVTSTDTAALVAAINAVPANAASAASSATLAVAAAASVASSLPAKGADVASATTINLTATMGDFVHVTGATPISTITIPVGAQRTVIFDGILTLTHGAALLIPGAANITTAAGDRMVVRGDTAGANVVSYTRANGTPVVSTSALVLLATLTPTAGAVNLDALNVFTSQYDSYRIVAQGLGLQTDGAIGVQFAVAGAADNAGNYATGDVGASSAFGTNVFVASPTIAAAGRGLSFISDVINANDATFQKNTFTNIVAEGTTANSITAKANYGGYKGVAVSGVRIFASTTFKAQGSIRIYGVQKA